MGHLAVLKASAHEAIRVKCALKHGVSSFPAPALLSSLLASTLC